MAQENYGDPNALFRNPDTGAERGSLHATAVAIDLLPEKPMGRRGSTQQIEDVEQALDNHLPTALTAIENLGGRTIVLNHTVLRAVLPPDADHRSLCNALLSPSTSGTQPSLALVDGPIEWLHTEADRNGTIIYYGPAVNAACRTLSSLSAGDCSPDGSIDLSSEPRSLEHQVARKGRLADGVEQERSSMSLCAVALPLSRRTKAHVAAVEQLATEFDGRLLQVYAEEEDAVAIVGFNLAGGEAASEHRACDLALLLRDQYGEGVRTVLISGEVIVISRGDLIIGLAGKPIVKATDLLEHAEPAQVLTDGATAEHITPFYALQPIGGVTHGGKRSPAGTTVILWREHPVATSDLFVGRGEELEEIQSYLSRSTREVLHVTGPPGIGKSTLVRRIVRSRPASSVLVVSGNDRLEAPFASLTDGIREYWDLPEQNAPHYASYLSERIASTRNRIWDEALLEEWDRVELFIQHAMGQEHPVASALDPQTRYGGQLDGLVILLQALQAIRVLWIDDLQWIDAGSTAVLNRWLADRDPGRLRVLTTVRTHAHHPEGAMTDSLSWDAAEIELIGLPEEPSRALLEQRGTTALIDQTSLRTVLDHCQGNPFFLDQCARFVEEEGATGDEPTIPDSVHAVILARIERLSSDVRQAVEMAAVLGLRFDMRILSAMLREEKLPNALDSARSEGFWEAVSELNFIFCHALIRDAIYEAQFESRRVELHAAAARAFEHVYTDETRRAHLYQLAEHCEHAGQTPDAIRYLAEAAEYALEQYQNNRAVGLLRRRLALAGENDLRAVHDLARALERTGAWEESLGLLKAATSRDADGLSHEQAAAHALCSAQCADLMIERGQTREAEELALSALSAIDGLGLHEGAALLYRSVGLAQFQATDYQAALDSFETALDHARASEDERTVGRLMNSIAVVHSRTGRHREALAVLESNLELAHRLNDLLGKSSALNNIGHLYNEMGEFEKAMPYFERDLALCTEAGHRQGQGIALGNIASILASLGRHEEAIEKFLQTIEIDTRIGFLPHKAYNLQQLGTSLIASGKREEGCIRLHEAVALAEEIDFQMVAEQASESLTGCDQE